VTRTIPAGIALTILFLVNACLAQSTVPRAGHAVLIIEENHQFSQVYPSGMPWIVSQAQANGGIATNFTSSIGSFQSLGAYLWLSSGSTEAQFGCNGSNCSKPITDDNIFRELDMRGMTWKVYAQSLPSVGYLGNGPAPYIKGHNAAVWYSSVINNPSDLQRVVPFTQFQQDLNANNLPEYSIIIPDGLNDAHDGTLAQADAFLQANIAPLLTSSYFQPGGDGLLLFTFDECGGGENSTCGAHIFSALIGPLVKHGYMSSIAYSQSDMLRTIEDVLNLQPYFGAAASAKDMADFFGPSSTSGGSCAAPNSPGVDLCSPQSGQTYSSPVAVTAAGTGASGTVNHMELWIDGQKIGNYFANTIATAVPLGTGSHAATAIEVDSTGAFIKSTPSVFVVGSTSGACAPPGSPGAILCSPVAGQTYGSPIQVTGAGTQASGAVNHLELWIDGKKIGNYPGNTISTTVAEPTGSHAATLVAVDAKGNYLKSAVVSFMVQ
jgi:phosphatidylinositol-3-phosphatase